MSSWDATHYLRYGVERTRAASDLVARIRLEAPATVVDLGCGPGNSSRLLRRRWPDADLLGVDSSPEMIQAARQSCPAGNWQLADVATWAPDGAFDLVYSNAALHWLSHHGTLIPRLFSRVASSGALAFQIPSRTFATIRTLIHEVSREAAWSDRLDGARQRLTMESPSFYYDALAGEAADLDIWETEYQHVMESTEAIIDWISSTGLRPFLAALESSEERDAFLAQLRRRVAGVFESRRDGKVLFPFRRTFVIAYR